MGNRTHRQWETWSKGMKVNTADRDGAPGGIGHMCDRHMGSGHM